MKIERKNVLRVHYSKYEYVDMFDDVVLSIMDENNLCICVKADYYKGVGVMMNILHGNVFEVNTLTKDRLRCRKFKEVSLEDFTKFMELREWKDLHFEEHRDLMKLIDKIYGSYEAYVRDLATKI